MHPFADLPLTAETHFKLYLYGAIAHVLERLSVLFGSPQTACEQFPFLHGYADELVARGVPIQGVIPAMHWWDETLARWEHAMPGHLPLRALREAAGLDYATLTLWLNVGLIEEDARFGLVFESLQTTPGQRRPEAGLLALWWQDASGAGDGRAALRHLQSLGLLQVVNPDAPRSEWALHVPGVLWDAARGAVHELTSPFMRYHAVAQLTPVADLILPDNVQHAIVRISSLLTEREIDALIVRGPQHNGRRTLLGAIARTLGKGLLEVNGVKTADDERWRTISPLASLLHALPVAVFDLTPGESANIPQLRGYTGPLGIVLGPHGGLHGPGVERAQTVTLDIPEVTERYRHWAAGLGSHDRAPLAQLSEHTRMTSGNIRRAATLAQSYAAVEGRSTVTLADVRQASQALNRYTLETLAARLPVAGDWQLLALSPETMAELLTLETRCRYRERLQSAVGVTLSSQMNVGVRVLFSGPSGTGKTLAARVLASVLQLDLYRLDLSAVVNKYIGETEKNLAQVFARAEELNVILLLDEGDALLTQRTDVQTANDRYANLETNYLLQRIESFTGILLITTNAADRIDGAFQRRMDMVIDFRPPEAAERWAIWQLHLPTTHTIANTLLDEVAQRCVLNGGQIRNVVLHATVLALNEGIPINATHLHAALQREYRKTGAVCPLRRAPVLSVMRG